MNGILVPCLWIDGKLTKLLKPLIAAGGNTYFAPSKQANQYGLTVTETDLPNGLDTQFSIGTPENKGVTIPTSPFVDTRVNAVNPSKVSGLIEVPIGGKKMDVYVMVHELKDANGENVKNDDGLKLFTLLPRVSNKKQRKTYSTSEIYV